LSAQASGIFKQLQSGNCKDLKKSSFGTTHYTITLCHNEGELKAFAFSGTHLATMKLVVKLPKKLESSLMVPMHCQTGNKRSSF